MASQLRSTADTDGTEICASREVRSRRTLVAAVRIGRSACSAARNGSRALRTSRTRTSSVRRRGGVSSTASRCWSPTRCSTTTTSTRIPAPTSAPSTRSSARRGSTRPKDTAVSTPNSDTPYSFAAARPARRADGALHARDRGEPLLRRAAHRHVHRSTTATWAAARPATAPAAYMVAGPGWSGETPQGVRQVFRSETDFTLDDLPHPALRAVGHAECREGAGGLHGPAALGLPRTAGAAAAPDDRLAGARRPPRSRGLPEIPELPLAVHARRRRSRRRSRPCAIASRRSASPPAPSSTPRNCRPTSRQPSPRRSRPRPRRSPPPRTVSARRSTAGRSARRRAAASSSTATGRCARPARSSASTATARRRRPIPSRGPT